MFVYFFHVLLRCIHGVLNVCYPANELEECSGSSVMERRFTGITVKQHRDKHHGTSLLQISANALIVVQGLLFLSLQWSKTLSQSGL